ncbi:MAG TPA: methyltransferase domain-containing protein [Bacteroidetes bacterium]|nr:methyltransferase domain-containing protein [Bacteroidota bacterium]
MKKGTLPKKKVLDVESYYEGTRWDYRWVWGVRNTHALHFGYYDETATHHEAAVANMNRVMADLIGIGAGCSVLDAGCGVGGSGIWLAENRGCSVVGITPVEAQVRDASFNAAKRGLGHRAVFLKADYTKAPFDDGAFDVVWALESVCHAERKLDFYKEAYRLLRPGGRLVMTEYLRLERPFCEADELLLQNWLRAWAIPDLDTPEEHRQHANAAGFQNFASQDITEHTQRSLRNIRDHCHRWLWAAKLLNKTGLVSDLQVANVMGTLCQYDALQKGLWHYGLLSAQKGLPKT